MFDNSAAMSAMLGIPDYGQMPQPPTPTGAPYQSPAADQALRNAPPPQSMPMPPPRPPDSAPSVDETGMAQVPQGGPQGGPQGVPLPPPAPNANFDQRFAAAQPGLPTRSPPTTDEAGMIAGAPGMGANAQQPPGPPPGPPLNILPPGGFGKSGMAYRPPMPPMADARLAPPTQSNGGGLAGALGLNPQSLRSALAGLGKGLSAVGSAPRGATAGQMFAAGAGGSLQGQTAEQDNQQKTLFNQQSQYFKDKLAEKASGNTNAYRQAQGQYLLARAKSLASGAGPGGSRSMLNTPDGKVAYVENQALKMRDQLRKSAEAKSRVTGEPVNEEQIEKATQEYRGRLYKQFKIDPNEAEKIKTRGEDKNNPFETKGMTLEQFNGQVPMGAWFKDQNGTMRQRTVPPPGSDAAGSSATGPANAAVNADDQAAMTDAA